MRKGGTQSQWFLWLIILNITDYKSIYQLIANLNVCYGDAVV